MDITIRNLEDCLIEALNNQAALAGLSREEYLRQELARLTATTTTPRSGHGLRGFTATGGMAVLLALGPNSQGVQGGAKALTSAEMDAFRRAKLLAAPANGAHWDEARAVLETAGFEVFAE